MSFHETVYMTQEKILPKQLEMISNTLRNSKETIAVAESVTAGLLQYALSTAKDASQFFQGGITAFNLGQKAKHLDVEPIQAECCDCVSEEVAQQMALGAECLFKSTWGIGVTGYATPVPASGNMVFCYYALSKGNKILQPKKISTATHEGERAQHYFIEQIIAALYELLNNKKLKS